MGIPPGDRPTGENGEVLGRARRTSGSCPRRAWVQERGLAHREVGKATGYLEPESFIRGVPGLPGTGLP